jgi:hypothetical protein
MAAYKKFLSGEPLSEVAVAPHSTDNSAPGPSSQPPLDKIHRQLFDTLQMIQREAAAWHRAHPERESELGSLSQLLDTYLRADNTVQAQQTADMILRLIRTNSSAD